MSPRYDAGRAPDPATWASLDAPTRRALVEAAHPETGDALHPPGYKRAFHAALHVVVEDWIAAGAPREVGEAVDRLTGEGLRRHAALHAVIDAVMPHLTGDTEALVRAVRAVRAAEWLGNRLGAPRVG